MNQRTATSKNTAVGALLAAALVSGTFASTALGGGATADADGFASLAVAAGNDGAQNRPFPADAT